MPGISIARQDGDGQPDVASALDAVCFFDEYEATVHHDGDSLTVATTGYEGYPVRTVALADQTVLLEGYLYDVDDTAAHLREVAALVDDGDETGLREWMRARDGDFLVVVVDHETEAVTIVPDGYGRLPLYHAQVGETTVVSRELKFVRELAIAVGDGPAVDDLAVAQTLLFGYRLGTRTLFDGVERLPPAATLTVTDERTVSRLFTHDFGTTAHADRSMTENAAALADRFRTAVANRADLADTNVLGLSGGLDSRAVAAGLDDVGADYQAATFARPDDAPSKEVQAARAVADELDVDWDRHVARNTDEHQETLLELKQGMNYLRLSFLVDFLEQLNPPLGRATYITGDGGDKAFPDMRPPTTFTDLDDLVDYTISANSIFDLSEAAAIAGVSTERLRASVRDRLETFPEQDLRDVYVHFLVRERGMNWLYQGEDRNRYYYWSVSPFYAPEFFEYAMNVPASQKGPGDLYAAFFRQLAPELLDIEYVNFGAPITSTEYRLKRFVYDALSRYPSVQDTMVDLVKRVTDDSTVSGLSVVGDIARELDDNDDVDGTLSVPDVENVIQDPSDYGEPEMYHLLTVATLVNRQPAD